MPRLTIPLVAVVAFALLVARAAEAQVCPSLPRALAPGIAQPDDETGYDVAASGSRVVVGRPGSHGRVGSAIVQRRDGDSWVLEKLLQPFDSPSGAAFGLSVAIDGDRIVIGAPFDGASGMQSGSVYVYDRSGTNWLLTAKIAGQDAFSLFGFDVAISGPTIAVADLSSFDERVKIFRETGGILSLETSVVAPGGAPGALFGQSVALSGDRLAAGAPAADSNTGAVYVFERGTGDWSTAVRLFPSSQQTGERFGTSVALAGDRLVAGAPRSDVPTTDAGLARVFRFDGLFWTEETTLAENDNWASFQGGSGDKFGESVAIDGDTILVGAPGKDDKATDAGATYAFTRNEGEWIFQQKFLAPGGWFDWDFGHAVAVAGAVGFAGAPATSAGTSPGAVFALPCFAQSARLPRPSALEGERFGFSVSACGETLLVGAPFAGPEGEENTGSASVWVPKGTAWEMEAELVPAEPDRFSLYGFTVSLSGDTAAIGSNGARVGGVRLGAVFVFVRSGGAWTEEQKVSPPGLLSSDAFALAVAIDGDTMVASAYLDDDFGENAGSAYVFTRSGGAWSLEQQIFPGETVPFAHFGASLAISGDTIVVGAPNDEFGHVGIGAAYVFTRSGGVWTREAKLVADVPAIGDRFGTSVAVSGDTIAVGQSALGGPLATSLFSRSSGWAREAVLVRSVATNGEEAVSRVSLGGNLLAVAVLAHAASPGLGRGAVTLWVRSGGAWRLSQTVPGNETNLSETFGSSVSVDRRGAVLAIGDMTKTGRVNNDGALYAYRLDTIPPVIDCPGDLVVRKGAMGGAFVGFYVTATDDLDPAPLVECSPESGSFFPTGATTVTCRATDVLQNESTCSFVVNVVPDEVFFRQGNVNGASGTIVDVLFVNDSAGDPVERTILLSTVDPLVMRVANPPSRGRQSTRLAMYVWLRAPTASTVRTLPAGIGVTCLPTPLNGPGGPQPKRIANSIGRSNRLGVENWPGPPTRPAPTVLLDIAAIGKPLTLFAQGLILDSSAPNDQVAVTNGVLVLVSE